jgi:alpha-amylase
MRKILSIALLSALLGLSKAGDTAAWKKRAVYQVITDRFWKSNGERSNCDLSRQPYYCGGDFDGLKQKLQYIKDLGFDAIWISPVVDNTENGFHGYWARDWNKINDHFGGADALKRLVDTAHSMDIWVMVDVVANHVGPVGNDFSQISPFNQPQHYHPNCDINDWGNQWQVENCRLAGLPDLKQEDGWVRQ